MTLAAAPHFAHGLLERCRADPLFFSQHILGGPQPWDRQADILRALRDARRVAVRSGHGVGKTWVSARAALWFLYVHPHSIVLTTAPTQRQVRSILWAEIRRQVRAARLPLGGKLTETRLALDDDWFALGAATDDPDRFQGYHAEHLLLIFDEAPGISPEIYEAAAGLLTSRHARVLLIGNPTTASGPFHEVFRTPGWRTLHIACTQCPNVIAGRAVYPRLVTREWVEAQRAEWGDGSPAFRARVLGEFPEEDETRLVPLAWIHAAQARADDVLPPIRGLRLGVDVARYGLDLTVFLLADAHAVRQVIALSGLSTMETAGRILDLARRHDLSQQAVSVDDTGVGGGVTDRLAEQGFRVNRVVAAGAASSPRFLNRRAELFWRVRDRFRPDTPCPLALPKHPPRLGRELTAITYAFTSRGRIQIESKDALRIRLRTSPDYADALALACADSDRSTVQPRLWAP